MKGEPKQADEWINPAQYRRTTNDRILRWPAVRRLVGISRNTVCKLEREGKFPRRQNLTDYAVGWKLSEVQRWVDGERAWK